MSILSRVAAAAVLSTAFALPASAQEVSLGDLTISKTWTRATPPGAKVGGGFMQITNKGKTADRLLGVSSDISERGEVHETTITDGVMKMREMTTGVEIAPGATLELKPGSYHVMFINLKKPLAAGETVKAKLKFEKAGEASIDLKVEAMGSGASGHMKH